MKAKIILLLSIFMFASFNAFAEEYKGRVNEKHAKKARKVHFRIPGYYESENGHHIDCFAVAGSYNENSFTLFIFDRGKDGFCNSMAFDTRARPYIENINGKITIFGTFDYNLVKNERYKKNRLYINIEPEIDGRYASYFLRIYIDSDKNKPIVEKQLYRINFVDKNSDYRDAENISEELEYFWIWLENNLK